MQNRRTSLADLLGKPVCDRDGETLGHVEDVILDASGRASHVAIHLESRHRNPLAVPWSQLEIGVRITLDVRPDTLQRLVPQA